MNQDLVRRMDNDARSKSTEELRKMRDDLKKRVQNPTKEDQDSGAHEENKTCLGIIEGELKTRGID